MIKRKGERRKADTSTVGDAINEMLKKYHLKPKFDENRVIATWPALMGKTIAGKTGKVFIKNQVLFVEINSAPLKHELNMSKTKVLERLEKEFGKGDDLRCYFHVNHLAGENPKQVKKASFFFKHLNKKKKRIILHFL